MLQLLVERQRGLANVEQSIHLHNPLAGDAKAAASGSGSGAGVAGSTTGFVLNALDRDPACAVDAAGLLVQSRQQREWAGIRAAEGVRPPPLSGSNANASANAHGNGNGNGGGNKWMLEATVTDEGLCRLGWTVGRSGTRNLGTDVLSYGFGGTGKASHGGKFVDYGQSFGLNDVIGCYVEFLADDDASAQLSFSKNGVDLGVAFTVPPSQTSQGLFPAVVLKNAEIRYNFGKSPFKYPRAGFQPIAAVPKNQQVVSNGGGTPASSSSSSSASTSPSSSSSNSPFALIFEPTRELAQQVSGELTKFTAHLTAEPKPIRHECFVGGTDFNKMVRSLSRPGGVDIVVGTPGRLIELIKKRILDISQTRCLILDEADQLIVDTASKNDILFVYKQLPQVARALQVVICSATLHSAEITALAKEITHNATWVDLKGKDAIPDTVDHIVVMADPRSDRSWQSANNNSLVTDGVHAADNLQSDSVESWSEGIKRLKPLILLEVINQFKMEQCIIFARTQLDCDNLERFLIAAGGGASTSSRGVHGFQHRESGKENLYSCVVLHGGLPPPARIRNLDAFKSGEVRFLICTDVAARGIDVSGLPFVINLTLPDRPEVYIHRIGRVGRADAVGLAISIVAAPGLKEKQWFHTCNSRDRGKACQRTNLTNEGGCCIYFDEHTMLKEIEKRLGNLIIPKLERTNLSQGSSFIQGLAASKGRKVANDDGATQSALHVKILQPTAQQLATLEVASQCAFWNIQRNQKWRQMLQ